MSNHSRTVLDQTYEYSKTDAEKSRVTEAFELTGHRTNLQVAVGAELTNQWADFDVALVNLETAEALDFGKEIGFYEGRDYDGYWSEGSRGEIWNLPAVAPGRYYLRVEPAESSSERFRYRVSAVWGAPRGWYALAAAGLLVLPFLIVMSKPG